MAKRQNADIRTWAALGAEQRLRQIAAEAAQIFRFFPELGGRKIVIAGEGRRRRRGQRRPRRRGKLSAAGRAAISAAQKKRWAALKRTKASSES